jgi:hypothetical protein
MINRFHQSVLGHEKWKAALAELAIHKTLSLNAWTRFRFTHGCLDGNTFLRKGGLHVCRHAHGQPLRASSGSLSKL